MKKLLLSVATILFAVVSSVSLRGFIYGGEQGDPEGYIFLFSLICAVLAIYSLWRLTDR